MASKRISFHAFDQRLWLSGGRDQIPQTGLRRAVGIAPELTRSIQSRWGSLTLYPIDAISLYQFDGHRYQYDGSALYKDGAIIDTGFDGTRLTFAEMPPQSGLPDYLFAIGGGKAIKIAPALVGGSATPAIQQITQWGIDAPPDGMTAALGTQENKSIDTFDNTFASWTGSNCTLSNDTSDPYDGSGDLKAAVTAGPWNFHQTEAIDLSIYASGTLSIETDIISLWVKCKHPEKVIWLWITFSLGTAGAPDYKKDYYRLVVQLVQNTNNKHTAGAQLTVTPDGDRWVQVAAAKSVWTKVGAKNLDWSDVNGIQIRGGDPADVNTSVFFDKFEMYGGYALGAGPAALLGGSEYQYYVTFGNNTTGSDSDPNGMGLQADGTFGSPDPVPVGDVVLQAVNIKNIPVSTDPQVGNRKLWRTSAITVEGLTPPAFFLDIIPDNTTTTYIDKKADVPGIPIINTPWQPATAYLTTDYVDGGNGFYFKCSVAGTSGATIPSWNIPTTGFLGFWSPITKYLVGDWVAVGVIGYTAISDNYNVNPVGNPGTWQPLGTTADGAGALVWAWQGLNEVPHLGDQQMLLDNAPPAVTYGDAVVNQGAMHWCRDSVPGRRGWTYSSPDGRPESVANQFAPTSDDDPTQKQVVFDYTLWLITTKTAFQVEGQNPALQYFQVMSATGTSDPFSVVATAQRGIYYQAPDGIRMINRAGSILPGFDNIAPIQRHQVEENVAPFTATIAAYARNEVIFSDGTVSFGLYLGGEGFVWRMLGVGFNAIFYERNDDEILASFNGITALYEHPRTFLEGGKGTGFNLRATQFSIEVLMPNT